MADTVSEVMLWLDKAKEHLMSAELLFSQYLFGPGCFHTHQVAETSFKALIAWRGKTPPKIHDLLALHGNSTDDYPQLDHLVNDALRLDPFYLDTRYFDEIKVQAFSDPLRVEEALDSARRIYEAVLEITGI